MRLITGGILASLLSVPVLAGEKDPGPLVSALWLLQKFGTQDAVNPRNDQSLKARLSKGLKDHALTAVELEGMMEPTTFANLAGPDGRLDESEIQRALGSDVPESRKRLHPEVRAHAELLSTGFDMIDEPHQEAGKKLAEWIVGHYRPGQPLHVIVVCTGNSRRSILGSSMGNVAAAYYGMPEVRFHSGGTAPTAFNSRTVTALKGVGIDVEAVGREAPRGEPETANPVYRVRWGDGEDLGTEEFSKHYSDRVNPQNGFAALMVCSEADAGCPFVRGAALRVSMPYLDPKLYDQSPFEPAKYAERRDDMGRLLLSVMMQARNRLSGPVNSPH